jgi:nucleoside-diphosphate-sugar epimerase
MKLLVTGANGFLGRYVVAEALRRGHGVRAVVRSGANPWPGQDVELAQVDLRSRRGLVEALAGVDAVLHLAAAKAGDLYAQYAGTVVATENLLWAMDEAKVSHIVSISSFSVYDYMQMSSFSLVDESSPVEADAFDRDAYAHTKLVQENLVRETAGLNGWRYAILRPGVIFGKDNLWTARLGAQAGKKLWIRMGAWARLPLTYVENCAEAIVLAAENPEADGQTLNIVDDDVPTQRAYAAFLRKRMSPRPMILPVPWIVMRCLARLATITNSLLFKGRAKVPGVFVPCRLHARCKPLRYTNARIKQVLGWQPKVSWQEGVERSLDVATSVARASCPSQVSSCDTAAKSNGQLSVARGQ